MSANPEQSKMIWKEAFKSHRGDKVLWNAYCTKAADNLLRNGHEEVSMFVIQNCFYDLSRHDS